jgi:hypothetical protein
LTALNSKKMVGSIFFDLAKAFDWVNHLLLMQNYLTTALPAKLSYY